MRSSSVLCTAATMCQLLACTGSTTAGDTDTTTSQDTGTVRAPPEATWSNGILEFQETVSLGPGSTWTGIVADDDHVYVSLKDHEHLWLQVLDHALNTLGDRVQLTFDSDVPADQNLADHKLYRLQDRLYISWNPNRRNDLYMLAFDLEGNRLMDQVRVEYNADTSTADMHLTGDGKTLTLVYGTSGTVRRLAELDKDLNVVSGPREITMGGVIDQLGTTLHFDDRWYMFTGDETNQNLAVSFFEADWTPEDPFSKVLVEGDDEFWHWFPSGADHSRDYGAWSTVFHTMPASGHFETDASIKLAVFGQDLELDELFDVGGTDYHAADITSRGACVYVASAWSNVTIDRYRIKAPDGWEDGETTCAGTR